jgi:hypothetical protein
MGGSRVPAGACAAYRHGAVPSVMPMAHTNLCISLRQATPADSAFAYQVKKVALGEYIKQTYGRWDGAFQREFHFPRVLLCTQDAI